MALDPDLPFWIALNKVPGIGPKRFGQLIQCFGSARAAWEASPEALAAAGIGPRAAETLVEARRRIAPEEEMARVVREGVGVLALYLPGYPRLLAKIPDPPPVLFVRGKIGPEDEAAVAVVGTRNPTPTGRFTAERLAGDLARQGVTIVSGMARGIDTAAHRGAIEAGGRTIAVLGSGLDVVYPPENLGLYEEIAAGRGAVVSESPLGTDPLPMNFPARNRVISGLSLGVVVIEAASDSGSLITAGHAAEQGREVFAVPGPVELELSRGPNRLIKQGAKLVEGARDILEELSLPLLSATEVAATREAADLTPEEERILGILTHEPRHVDLIVRESGLASGTVGATLVILEMKGLVHEWPGGLFARVR
ncbi:MAG: DNA-processing protein DprA [Firmicutes bacterium]|nr:DNA-processing protein DprA [Bacillota bacterium]